MAYSSDQISRRTYSAYMWTRILGTPFWWLMGMLPLILYKDMHITAFQVAAIVTLKPMSAILAPYWSQAICGRSDRLISNLSWSHLFRYLPFVFLPFVGRGSPWFVILSFGLYMMLCRGTIPAWMETCKCNLSADRQRRLVGYGTIIDYCGIAALTFIFGPLLDHYRHAWEYVVASTAALGLISSLFLYRIPTVQREGDLPISSKENHIIEHFLKPWHQARSLLSTHKDFRRFLIGFMLGGTGLMIVQPALPMFFVDTLDLSYTNMFLAIATCKGIGVALSTPFWTRLFHRFHIHFFCGIVTLLAALYPLLLLTAQWHVIVVYIAFGLYGVMQGGSELSWHLSGPIFAKEKESSPFSSTNVLMVGIRGCTIPVLGTLCYSIAGSDLTLAVASLFCLIGSLYLFRHGRKKLHIETSSLI